MSKKFLACCGLFVAAAFSATSTDAQPECGLIVCGEAHSPFLTVTGCGTSCQIGQTITFTMTAERNGFDEDGECPLRDPECCIETCPNPVTPPNAWYEGWKKVGSQWVKDANCVQAPNPLTYTFVAGDEGTYRRQACTDGTCGECSNTLTITVDP